MNAAVQDLFLRFLKVCVDIRSDANYLYSSFYRTALSEGLRPFDFVLFEISFGDS